MCDSFLSAVFIQNILCSNKYLARFVWDTCRIIHRFSCKVVIKIEMAWVLHKILQYEISQTSDQWRMSSSGMWRRVDIVLTDVSEEHIASIFRVAAVTCSRWFFAHRILIPWRWRWYIALKRRLTQYLHGLTSQKTAFFIVTAVKISNLTYLTSGSILFDVYRQIEWNW
jgi:hypothetical protein